MASRPQMLYKLFMNDFRKILQQELTKKIAKNPNYSLRAFADYLEVSHATLSRVLTGKRNMSTKTIRKIANKLDLSPAQLALTNGVNKERIPSYYLIQEDIFNSVSEWYYDAILELTFINQFEMSYENISKALSISLEQTQYALETLIRLNLIKKIDENKYQAVSKNTTNELDANFTNTAKRKYQLSILEKSCSSLENVPRDKRDHTSTTMAIKSSDLSKVKELIKKFRHELNGYLQRAEVNPDQVYQLQVSFFPLTNINQEDI